MDDLKIKEGDVFTVNIENVIYEGIIFAHKRYTKIQLKKYKTVKVLFVPLKFVDFKVSDTDLYTILNASRIINGVVYYNAEVVRDYCIGMVEGHYKDIQRKKDAEEAESKLRVTNSI